MSTASLTARYRPQTFAQVAGQDTLKTILSRASLEGKVAPAYLFSGTRGVGKTTLARVFAKALNCRTAPTAEPCNECDQCKAVTLGNAVDVVEIDGASNRGIDDVRRLKEVVGYAPMEGRYKIFIIDEAHMLSREAFNALLKTLEEPPARVTFIMATTEPHKFPATIISRCQHYVFKRLSEPALAAHLASVLRQEQVEFESTAVNLIARRGAGSVRDSMSLLGQVLALGTGPLTDASTRNVLGLVGQEAFIQLLAAFQKGDTLALIQTLRDMLEQGLDMGFFLRELAALWRNLFILKQSGEKALAVLDLPEAEARNLLAVTQGFTLTHIHASWQMTLEGQRRVLTSLEPALALELLLLNIALLPELLSLEQLTSLGRRKPSPAGGGNPSSGGMPGASGFNKSPSGSFPAGASGLNRSFSGSFSAESSPGNTISSSDAQHAGIPAPATLATPPALPQANAMSPVDAIPQANAMSPVDAIPQTSAASPVDAIPQTSAASQMEAIPPRHSRESLHAVPSRHDTEQADATMPLEDMMPPSYEGEYPEEMMAGYEPAQTEAHLTAQADAPSMEKKHPSWEQVLERCQLQGAPAWFIPLMTRATGVWQGDTFALETKDTHTAELIAEERARSVLVSALQDLCGSIPALRFEKPVITQVTRDTLKQEILAHPFITLLEQNFDARILDYGQLQRSR